MKSNSSDEVSATAPAAEQPNAPSIAKVVFTGNTAQVTVNLPTTSIDGNPLAALSKLHVFADTRSFLGDIEGWLGLEPKVSVDITVAQAGQQVVVNVPGLSYGTKYYFTAAVE